MDIAGSGWVVADPVLESDSLVLNHIHVVREMAQRLSLQERTFLFQRTQVQFTVPMLGSSQSSATPDPGDPTPPPGL